MPVLRPGQVVVLDNATFHKSQSVRQLIEDAGCNLVFLPAYSTDLNPIETFWANFKAKIRKTIAQFQSLQQAIDHTFNLFISNVWSIDNRR